MKITKVSEDSKTKTLAWDEVPDAAGFKFDVDGKISHTWQGDRTTVRVDKNAKKVIVDALGVLDTGEYPGVVTPPPPPPVSSGMPDRSLEAWLAQSQIEALQAVTTTLSSWDGYPVAGKRLIVTGAGVVSSTQAARLCSWKGAFAAVQLDNNAAFRAEVPMSSSAGAGRKNLAIFGGNLGNHNGYGIRFSAANDIQWWGGTIEECGRTGILVHGNVGDCNRLDLAFNINHCGLDLSGDPHSEKGTGLHAAYLADTGGNINDGRYWFVVRNQPYGAALQLGPALNNSRIFLDAENVTFNAQRQVGGNALQWWGGRNNIVEYVRGVNLAGRLSETDGGSGSGNRILVGRYKNVCQNPRLSNVVCAPGVPCADLQEI
jgi:hypothetical protein